MSAAAPAPEDSQPQGDADELLEATRIAADIEYLAKQRERDAQRVAETANLERAYVARRGWAV